jgi:NAD(P)-dependent dehydrogenase (short-subunit alcohol dehydrogenase family)
MPLEVSLEGQVGLVTGAGTPYGIGRELVLKLAAAGAKAVYACDLNTTHIATLQQAVKDSGSSCQVEGRFLEVVSEEKTLEVLREIITTHGRFDFYYANAGFANYRYRTSHIIPCHLSSNFLMWKRSG